MQRFRWAIAAAVVVTAAASVMAGITAAPGDRSGIVVRTPRSDEKLPPVHVVRMPTAASRI